MPFTISLVYKVTVTVNRGYDADGGDEKGEGGEPADPAPEGAGDHQDHHQRRLSQAARGEAQVSSGVCILENPLPLQGIPIR